MNPSMLHYCIFDPVSKVVLSSTTLHGYNAQNKPVYRYSFTDDLTRTHLMNASQAKERLQRMRAEEYQISENLKIEVSRLEIKKIEVSYLLLE